MAASALNMAVSHERTRRESEMYNDYGMNNRTMVDLTFNLSPIEVTPVFC